MKPPFFFFFLSSNNVILIIITEVCTCEQNVNVKQNVPMRQGTPISRKFGTFFYKQTGNTRNTYERPVAESPCIWVFQCVCKDVYILLLICSVKKDTVMVKKIALRKTSIYEFFVHGIKSPE